MLLVQPGPYTHTNTHTHTHTHTHVHTPPHKILVGFNKSDRPELVQTLLFTDPTLRMRSHSAGRGGILSALSFSFLPKLQQQIHKSA